MSKLSFPLFFCYGIGKYKILSYTSPPASPLLSCESKKGGWGQENHILVIAEGDFLVRYC